MAIGLCNSFKKNPLINLNETINIKYLHSFPLEMHMVHFKKEYKTFSNAINYPDGLAVVGLFFDVLY